MQFGEAPPQGSLWNKKLEPQERFATKKCGSGNPSSGQPLDDETGALQGECSSAPRYQKLRFGEALLKAAFWGEAGALQGGCSRALRYQDLRPLRFQNRCGSKTEAVRRPKADQKASPGLL